MDILSIIESIGIFSAVTVFLFEIFQNKVIKKYNILLSKTMTQILTWVFSFIIVYISGLLGFGTFGGVNIIYTIIIGILTGLTANGIWSFPPLNNILNTVKK